VDLPAGVAVAGLAASAGYSTLARRWYLGLGMHSADEILPQFQHPAVADVLPVGPNGSGMRVEICESERTLAFPLRYGAWPTDASVLRAFRKNRRVS
jgi:hypothetical protein